MEKLKTIKNLNEEFLDNRKHKGKESIEEFLKEQGLEHVPKIEVDFYFTDHQSKNAGEILIKLINDENVDIFMPEGTGVTPAIKEEYDKLSNGQITPEEFLELRKARGVREEQITDFHELLCRGLYNSHKKVLLVDLPEGHRNSKGVLTEQMFDVWRRYEKIISEFVDKNLSFEDLKNKLSSFFKDFSNLQKEREDFILDNIKKEVFKLFQENKLLQNKEKVKILFPIGSFHTRIYHEMKKDGNLIHRKFDEGMPYNYDTVFIQTLRTVHFEKRESIRNGVLNIIFAILKANLEEKDVTEEILSRMDISKISSTEEEKVHELYEIYRMSGSDEIFKNKAKVWFSEQLANK